MSDFTKIWNNALADVITRNREKNNLSKKDLGQRVDLTSGQIWKYEKGLCSMKLQQLPKFAKALNQEPEAMLSQIIFAAKRRETKGQ